MPGGSTGKSGATVESDDDERGSCVWLICDWRAAGGFGASAADERSAGAGDEHAADTADINTAARYMIQRARMRGS